MPETIFTKHPQKGRSGHEISRRKYDLIRAHLTEVLLLHPGSTERELVTYVEERMQIPFEGDVSWYVHVVALDLVARRLVLREREGKKEHFSLAPELPL